MHINNHTRHEVVFEFERCKNISQVARKLRISRKTVQRWVRTYTITGKVTTKSGQGRKRGLDKSVATSVVSMLLSGDYMGCKDVANHLFKVGKTCGKAPLHRTTILRHAKAAASEAGSPIRATTQKPSKQLSAATISKRLDFCERNKTRNWGNVMFTDRKKFHFMYPGTIVKRSAWLKKGEKRVAFKSGHALCVNMYAGITKFGVTKPHFVAGSSKMVTNFKNKKGNPSKNITSMEYEQVLYETLLPEGRKIFSIHGVSNWVLQQDNDPTHKKASIAALDRWRSNQPHCAVSILSGWPPHSPDLSPIENVWAYVQSKVDVEGCKTFEEFKDCVTSTFRLLPKVVLHNLYKSMKARISQCIERFGGKTKY